MQKNSGKGKPPPHFRVMAKFKRFFKLKSSLKLLIAQDCLVSVQQQGASFITTGGFDVLFSLLQEYHNQAILFKMSYSQNHQTHVSFSKNVTINVILYGCSLRLRQPILSHWSSVWRHEGWRVPLKTCPSSSTPIASLLSRTTGRLLSVTLAFYTWENGSNKYSSDRALSQVISLSEWFLRLPSLNMMKMQLYIFTQIIDLIEADQVRFEWLVMVSEQARAVNPIFSTLSLFRCKVTQWLVASQRERRRAKMTTSPGSGRRSV